MFSIIGSLIRKDILGKLEVHVITLFKSKTVQRRI